jgi:hypothetical protein
MVGRNDFPSVSKIMKKFYNEFDAEEVSLKVAQGDLERQRQLISEWSAAGEYATNMGSRVHYMLEKELIDRNGSYKEIRKPIFECDAEQIIKSDKMIFAGKNYLDLMEQRNVVLLDTEMVLGDPDLGYTGQPDKVWLTTNASGDDFGILITDYKTNKPKNFVKNQYTKKMLSPFQEYDDTALSHYYLQLPLYGKLLMKMLQGTKYENIKLLGCIIVLLKDDETFTEYRVPKQIINTIINMEKNEYLN